jgi:hypothetical protein
MSFELFRRIATNAISTPDLLRDRVAPATDAAAASDAAAADASDAGDTASDTDADASGDPAR